MSDSIEYNSNMKSFGTMGKELTLLSPAEETKIFHHEGNGCITHMWFGGIFSTFIKTRIRVYIDGESEPSIDMEIGQGHGKGYDDDSGPWGIARIGQTGHPGGIYNTYRIPFGKSVQITVQMDKAEETSPLFWWIIRGVENMSVIFSGIKLPQNARLKLYTLENFTAQKLEEFAMCDVKGSGMLYQTSMTASSSNFNYMEACIRAYIDGDKNPLMISSGLEDYFLGTYYFHRGLYQNPVAGITHLDENDNSFSAYRFHENDPVFFEDGFRLTCRVGEEIDGRIFWDPQETTYTTYVWIYQW